MSSSNQSISVNSRQAQNIIQDNKTDENNRQSLKILKNRLLIYLVLIACFFLIVILERSFYPYVISAEKDFIETLQKSLHIDNQKEANDFFKLIGSIGGYRYFMIIVIHIYLLLYFCLDAFLAIKIMVGHFIGLYTIYLLQMLYSTPRPF